MEPRVVPHAQLPAPGAEQRRVRRVEANQRRQQEHIELAGLGPGQQEAVTIVIARRIHWMLEAHIHQFIYIQLLVLRL